MKGRAWLVFLLVLACLLGSAVAQSLPVEVGSFATREPYSAVVYGDYLYIADGDALLIYNISVPERPVKVGVFDDFNLPRSIRGVSVLEGERLLYVAGDSAWIYVLDISEPEKPEKLYQITHQNNARDVSVSGHYMYVADANVGMLVFDLRGRRPVEVGRFYILKSNISGSVSGWGGIAIAVSGSNVYVVGDQRQGFFVLDVSNRSKPKLVYRLTAKPVYDVAALDNLVYLAQADGTPSVLVLDMSNPYKPQRVYNFPLEGTARRTAIAVSPDGEYVYVAADDTWHIFRFDKTPPVLSIVQPRRGEVVTRDSLVVSGNASDESGVREVLVNGVPAGNNSWEQVVTLDEGVNRISITAVDTLGNSVTEELEVIYQPPTPPAPVESGITKTPMPAPMNTSTVNATSSKGDAREQPGFTAVLGVMALVAVVMVHRGRGSVF